MHDEAFADAARPAPRCILRLPMQAYSIGHELILTTKRNTLLSANVSEFQSLPQPQQIQALISAAYVCSQTWEQNNHVSYGFWSNLLDSRRWKRWERAISGVNWAVEIADFRNYRQAGSLCPPLTDNRFSESSSDGDAGRTYGSPFMARLVNYLRQSMVPESVLMDYPLGRAAFEYFAYLEEQQRAQVENANEQETRLSFEKHAADIALEQAEREVSCRP